MWGACPESTQPAERGSLCPECSCETIEPLVFIFWGANNFRGAMISLLPSFSSFYIPASKQVLRRGGWVTQWYTTDYYRGELLGSFQIRGVDYGDGNGLVGVLWQVIVQKWSSGSIGMRCWLSIVDLFMSSLEAYRRGRLEGRISQQSIKHTIKEQEDLRHIGPKHRNLQAPFVIFLPGVLAWDPGLSRGDPRKKKPWHLCQVNWIATLDSLSRLYHLSGQSTKYA